MIDVDAFLRRLPPEKRLRFQRELNKNPAGGRAALAKALEQATRGAPEHRGDLVVPDQHKAAGRCPGCGGKPYAPKRTTAVPEITRWGQAAVVEVLCSHPFHQERK